MIQTERLFIHPVTDEEMRAMIAAEAEGTNLASQRVLQKAGFRPNGKRGEEGPRYTLVL